MTLREKQILARAIENPKRKLGVTTHFLEIIKQQIIVLASINLKYKAIYGIFFQIEALLSLKNAWLPPIFILDTKNTC